MFRNLLNPEGGLMITMGQITDVIFLSLFWLVLCIPVVTAGPATAALYDAVVHSFRRGEPKAWSRFFRSFRMNLRTGIPATILWAAAIALLGRGMIGLWNGTVAGHVAWPVFSGTALLALVVFGVLSVMFPLLSRFETGVGRLAVNTVLIALGNMPRTLALAALTAAAVYACMRWVWPVFILPCLAALVGSLFIEPMLRPYMPAEEMQKTE